MTIENECFIAFQTLQNKMKNCFECKHAGELENLYYQFIGDEDTILKLKAEIRALKDIITEQNEIINNLKYRNKQPRNNQSKRELENAL